MKKKKRWKKPGLLHNLDLKVCKSCKSNKIKWYNIIWFYLAGHPNCDSGKKLLGNSDVADSWTYYCYLDCPYKLEHLVND